MLKNYKDLLFAYFVCAITGCITLIGVFTEFKLKFVGGALAILWVLSCIIVLNIIAIKRFKSILSFAENCEVEKALNHFYGFYKGNTKSKRDLFWALQISNCLLNLGKHDLALNMLLQYNPEVLMKRKTEVSYRYSYYNTVAVCYSRLGEKEAALEAFKKSDGLFNSPYFNKKLKSIIEVTHKINGLIFTDDVAHSEEILYLLNGELNKCESLLAQVSCRFSIVRILVKNDRLGEASEHIEYIKQNGGDTVYAECVRSGDFSIEFLNKVNCEEWNPNPIKAKHYKGFILSGVVVACILALTTLISFFTVKTVYIHDYNGSGTQYIKTFDRNGKALTLEMKFSGEYYTEEDALEQYNFCAYYLYLNDYKGCEVQLNRIGEYVFFNLLVDFEKAGNDIYDITGCSKTEADYLDKIKHGEYRVSKYKKTLFLTYFEEDIVPLSY